MRLTGRVHSQKFPLKYNNLPRRTRPVSRICHAGAVANVDFKLCRSSWDGHRTCWKVETSSSEAKIVRYGAESLKIFPSRPKKGATGLSFFALDGKIEQQNRISARQRPRGPGLSKQQCPALTSSIESYDKHLKTSPPPPPKTTKQAEWTTEVRQGEFIYLISFNKVTFYFIARFYPSLFLNSIQCLVERSNSQRPMQCVTQHRALKAVTSHSIRVHTNHQYLIDSSNREFATPVHGAADGEQGNLKARKLESSSISRISFLPLDRKPLDRKPD